MQCRACLKIQCENTNRLDEYQIKCFHLITNICIQLEDSMPQQLCENCANDLKFCVEFREKCINSNSVLVSAFTSNEVSKITTQMKIEEDFEYDEITDTETHDKVEVEIKGEYLDINEPQQTEDNFEYEYVPDVKQPIIEDSFKEKSIVRKEKTKKLTPRAVKKKISTDNKKPSVLMEYECGLCTEKVEKDKLCEHVRDHETKNYCGICSLYFKDWETVLYHRVSHLQKPNLICHLCLSVFRVPISLEYHYNMKHLGKTEGGATCRDCNKTYSTLRNLKKHRHCVHNDTNTTFYCNKCSEGFIARKYLQNHNNKYHKKRDIMFYCKECDYKCKTSNSLREHTLRIHAGDMVCCKLCKAMFKDESRLKLHNCKYSTHSICPICGIVIRLPKQMKRHLETHSDERKHKCDRCDAAYKTPGALRVHLSKHDGVRPHKCEFCPAAFRAPSTLIKHRRTHTGEKPFVCKECNKGFTANHNLKVHMRVHGVYNLIKKRGAEEGSMDGCSN